MEAAEIPTASKKMIFIKWNMDHFIHGRYELAILGPKNNFLLVFDNAINETSSHYVRANVLRINVYFTLPFFSIGHFSIWNKVTTSK